MSKRIVLVMLLFGAAAAAPAVIAQRTEPELLGVRLGMSETEARTRLDRIGRLEKEERRDAVWVLDGDWRFTHLVVGFDKESRRVRYVTAKARAAAGGARLRYAEVLDLSRAKRVVAATNNYLFTQQADAHKGRPGYLVTARGTDPEFLTYLSVKIIERDDEKAKAAK